MPLAERRRNGTKRYFHYIYLFMNKRSFSIFFLTIFLANTVGFGLIALIQIKIHRESACWKKDMSKLVDLRISDAEINSPSSTFHWLEKNEFTFNGHRYDIISSERKNDILILKCFDDSKEESLYKKLKEHNPSNENNLPVKNKNVLFKKGIDYDQAKFNLFFPVRLSSVVNSSSIELFAPIVFQSVASPPPWLV